MTTSIQDCIDGLVNTLNKIPGFNAYDSADHAISTPAAIVSIDDVEFDADGNDGIDVKATVAVLIDRTHSDKFRALVALTEPNSATSIPTTINTHSDLGGLVAQANAGGAGQFGTIAYAADQYYGAVIRVRILGMSDG